MSHHLPRVPDVYREDIMHIENVLAFVAVALALIVIPGPDWAFILGASARDSKVAAPVLGLGIGYFVVTAIVAVGIETIANSLPWIVDGLTIVGSAYLLYLGFGLLRKPITTANGEAPPQTGRLFRAGIAVAVFNPKGLLFFLALLPQFTEPDSDWPIWQQIVLLGAVFLVVFTSFFALLGTFSRRMVSRRPSVARVVSRISGSAMIVISLLLLIERALAVWGR